MNYFMVGCKGIMLIAYCLSLRQIPMVTKLDHSLNAEIPLPLLQCLGK